MKTFWIMACVELYARVPPAPDDEDEDKRDIVGYFRNFGVTANSEEEACEFVSGQISDGEIHWSDSEISSDVVARLRPEIITRAGDWSEQGIWYASGRILFPEE